MEVKASLRFARVGAQKARLVADMVRNKNVNEAITTLTLMNKKSAKLFKKVIESAVANARQKQAIDVDNLFVKALTVDKGPDLKRYLPRAQGRASEIRKRLSHINVVLDER